MTKFANRATLATSLVVLTSIAKNLSKKTVKPLPWYEVSKTLARLVRCTQPTVALHIQAI